MHTLDFHRLHVPIRDRVLTHFQTTNCLIQTVMFLHLGPEIRVLLDQGIDELTLEEIRDATNKVWVLGENRFKQ